MKLRIWDGCSSLRCHFTSPFVRSKMWSLQNLTRHDHWKAKVTMAHGFRDICVWGRYDDTMWYASHQLHKLHHMFCKPCIVLKIPKIQTNWHYWDRFLTTSTGAIDSSPSSSLKFWIGKSSIIELRPLTIALTDQRVNPMNSYQILSTIPRNSPWHQHQSPFLHHFIPSKITNQPKKNWKISSGKLCVQKNHHYPLVQK